jgi:hypothetical protein
MEPRIYHGQLEPKAIAEMLVGQFNRGNLRAQEFGYEDQVVVQIATPQYVQSGGQTALSVTIQKVEDGVSVQVGKQAWLGVAASLGWTAFAALRNPLSLLGRLDDLAQDIENMQLYDQVMQAIDEYTRAAGASFELSDRLRRSVCPYCGTANPVNEPACIACGAPLGSIVPRTCKYCGFVLRSGETICPNCKRSV